MVDFDAFRSISYGLYLISSKADGAPAGCVVNTFAQVTSDPLQVSVAVNKENHTASVIADSGSFTAVSLSKNASMELIGRFGFHCSRDLDKFEPFKVASGEDGVPYVAEQACARFAARVVQTVDLGSHLLFVGEVVEAETLSSDEPMTYAYYHTVKGGKTPPKASSYIAEQDGPAAASDKPAGEKRFGWRCTVCGHILDSDELPDDYACPICGVGKEMFERVEL